MLFMSLGQQSKTLFYVWSGIGLVLYFSYGFWRSNVRRGVIEVPELEPTAPPGPIAPMPGAPVPTQDRG
jgi:APA family basic amino acid/polyamine antiporter